MPCVLWNIQIYTRQIGNSIPFGDSLLREVLESEPIWRLFMYTIIPSWRIYLMIRLMHHLNMKCLYLNLVPLVLEKLITNYLFHNHSYFSCVYSMYSNTMYRKYRKFCHDGNWYIWFNKFNLTVIGIYTHCTSGNHPTYIKTTVPRLLLNIDSIRFKFIISNSVNTQDNNQ